MASSNGSEACPDDEFIALFEKYGATRLAKLLDIAVRNIYLRRERLEKNLGRTIHAPPDSPNATRLWAGYPRRLIREIRDGAVLVGSDAHYWPGEATPAHRGFCALLREIKPKIACLNGDAADMPTASKHAAIGWAHPPTIQEELEVLGERTEEIREAGGSKCEYIWTIGNHDLRFDSALAQKSPERRGVHGSRISDHFPHWTFALGLWINDDVIIKHRFRSGEHATHNNTIRSGKTMVTGHLHSLKVTPFTDYNGTRYGVDTGTLSDPIGEHADYGEDNPVNHRAGFVVLTFKGGKLLWPEIAAVVDDKHIQFRGELIAI